MIKVVIPISGGKDSQACLKLALLKFKPEEIRGLFCDTKFEHPLTYAHVEKMRSLYGVQIDVVCGGDVLSKSIKYGRFPGSGSRHCTDELKIRETRLYLIELAKQQGSERKSKKNKVSGSDAGGFEVWYGMRSDESKEREERYCGKISDDLYWPHEVLKDKYPKYLGAMGVRFRLPILDWSKKEVFALLNGEENPLYAEGYDRVGCFPCLAAGDAHKEKAFKDGEFGTKQFIEVKSVSFYIKKDIFTSKGGKARNFEGCSVCSI